jgi:hypothetical protein
MEQLTATTARHIDQLRHELRSQFPQAPSETIERDVDEVVRSLMTQARFDDYVPVLVQKAVRERLRTAA